MRHCDEQRRKHTRKKTSIRWQTSAQMQNIIEEKETHNSLQHTILIINNNNNNDDTINSCGIVFYTVQMSCTRDKNFELN